MTDKTSFSLHGGVNVIGGTKLHLTSGDDELIFDFGATYEPGKGRFDPVLTVRPGLEAEDYRAAGVIPDLPYLYSASLAQHIAVFISHFHLDHVGMLSCLDPAVPLYISQPSFDLLRQLEVVGEGIGGHRNLRVFPYGEWIDFGRLKILPLPVEHDIPGASGFYVKTPDGTLAYTGDFRGHGLHPDVTTAFFTRLGKMGTNILVSEGTRAGEAPRPDAYSENELSGAIEAAVRPGKAAFFTLYNRNIERIATFARAARSLGRRLVLTPATHHLFRTLSPGEYNLSQPAVFVTQEFRVRGLPPWIAGLDAPRLTVSDIASEPAHFLTELPYANLNELVDLRPERGSSFIHSDGTPLGEFDPAFRNLKQWLRDFNLDLFFARSSGHASPEYLKKCVDLADPDILYPVHTTNITAMPAPPHGILAVPQLYHTYYIPAP
ncbi:Beta-lactamase superfamily domain protein [Acididesulfobacillus acetoxydans]|uniref:Beta-lactamase superfamily domain protein n=1 Tax=Acididesulfobacillus acetoxydans TaxID=1561005 RepID=A0A8S0X7D2_9FIRM|nr:MBL fold metallo-hydrolase [Acididesulfobacillus acetoxydans]CAA7603220.1 Beta-lactamase superfamily domain protein [Acididesulfobacillus acetoxydans]